MKAQEQNLKRIFHEQREEHQRFLGVLAQDFKSQVKLIAEFVMDMQQQLVSIRDMAQKTRKILKKVRLNCILQKVAMGGA